MSICGSVLVALLLHRRTEFSHGIWLLQVRTINDSSGKGFHNTQPTELGAGGPQGAAYGFRSSNTLI